MTQPGTGFIITIHRFNHAILGSHHWHQSDQRLDQVLGSSLQFIGSITLFWAHITGISLTNDSTRYWVIITIHRFNHAILGSHHWHQSDQRLDQVLGSSLQFIGSITLFWAHITGISLTNDSTRYWVHHYNS